MVTDDEIPRDPVCPMSCPYCGSGGTELMSEFGSTAGNWLYRCLACREPFEHVKEI